MPPGGPPIREKLNTDQAWSLLAHSFRRTIPAHYRGVRDSVIHMRQIRRRR